MFAETTTIDLVSARLIDRVEGRWVLEVRTATVITKDGEPVAEPTFHRFTLKEGDPVDGLDPLVIRMAQAVWGS